MSYKTVAQWHPPPGPPNLGPNHILQPNGHNLLAAIHTRNVPHFVALQLAQAKNGDERVLEIGFGCVPIRFPKTPPQVPNWFPPRHSQ
jgi:hypothetical protein